RWRGRTVQVVDGTTASLPDSADNRRAFPPPRGGYRGAGFPVARLVVLFSLAVGTVPGAALGRFRGQRTGEAALFRAPHEQLGPGDVLLAGRYCRPYWEIALVQRRGTSGGGRTSAGGGAGATATPSCSGPSRSGRAGWARPPTPGCPTCRRCASCACACGSAAAARRRWSWRRPCGTRSRRR